jgi:C1A family cysteine protease
MDLGFIILWYVLINMAAAAQQAGCCSYHANPFDHGSSLVECPITYIDQNACTNFYHGTWSADACPAERYVYSGRPYDGGAASWCGCDTSTDTFCTGKALHAAKLATVQHPMTLSLSTPTPDLYAAWREQYAPHSMLAETSSPQQAIAAYVAFSQTVDVVKRHSSSPAGQNYTLALNKYADTPPHVFKQRFGFRMSAARFPKTVSPVLATSIRMQSPIPSEADWRLMASVTDVKDQGACGSCWAFAATAALEGFYTRTTGNTVSFSTQPFVECASADGCNGGDSADVFRYVLAQGKGKVCNFAAEKYTGTSARSSSYDDLDGDASGGCNYDACTVDVNIKAVHIIPINDRDTLEQREDAYMRALVEHGPISVAVAAQTMWSAYNNGVLMPAQAYGAQDLNHAVLLVGYGVDRATGKGYWTLKNSWASSWGESGYFRLPRGSTGWTSAEKKWDKNGPFGMLSYEASYIV